MKKLIVYIVIFVIVGGGYWAVDKFYLSSGNSSSGIDVLEDIKLDETEIKNLAGIKLDTMIFRDLKFMSLREAIKTDYQPIQPGNKDIFREREDAVTTQAQ